jgi:outer membrane protein assembly factor BamB
MGLIKKVGTKSIGLPSSDQDQDTTRLGGDTSQQPAAPGTAAPGTRMGIGAMHSLAPGTVLQQRYTIEDTLGIGGMSIVYRGRDLRFKDVVRPVAVKEMAQSSPESHTRLLNLKNFEREASLLATLHHPAIPKIFDFFEENTRLYVIMELVQGQDLETILENTNGFLDEGHVGAWATQICDVLTYLHGHTPEPIVFRDMKPSNVMVTAENQIVLIDFGIARNLNREQKGTMIGTEGYSPPEQYRGTAEPQGDVYALGATIHHLLSRSDPRLETPFTFNERPIRKLNPGVSLEMEAVLNKALEYDLTARWASAEEFKQALLKVPAVAAITGTASGRIAPAQPGAGVVHTALSPQAELVWRFKCEDEVRSSPCVANGMLFIGCYDTNLYALDIARGEFRWKHATEGGISSSPSVWNDIVIIGSEDGVVYGIELRRGKARWSFRTGKAVRSSPMVVDRAIYVGSDDQHVYAIDGMTGREIWKYRTWMPIRSSAYIHEDGIYIGGNDGNVYCLDPRNGGLKWKQRTQQEVIARPVYANGLVIVGSMDNNLYALDAEGGFPAWKMRAGSYINSSACVEGKRVFVGCGDGNLYAVDMRRGRVEWKYETGSKIVSSPRAEGGRVYFGAVDGAVYAVDSGTGTLVWKYQTEAAIVSSPIVVEGIVYIGSLDQHVYALKA